MFIGKNEFPPVYMKAINTSDYIQQPDNRSFVNKKCGDPPNIRPMWHAPHNKLSLRTFQGVYMYIFVVHVVWVIRMIVVDILVKLLKLLPKRNIPYITVRLLFDCYTRPKRST